MTIHSEIADGEARHGSDRYRQAIVMGAGAGGLAAAAMLLRRGVEALVLEQSDQVGSSWRSRYINLHLNTVRWLSYLPGMPIPRTCGRWPSRESFVDYLDEYSEKLKLPVQFGTRVQRLERRDE